MAALSRSRGSLFFIFTLVCFACSHRKKWEIYKKFIEKQQQTLDSLKTERAITAELMSYSMSMMDPLTALVKKLTEESPDFPSLEGFVEDVRGYVEKKKTYVDEQNEHFDAIIETTEQSLATLKKLIKFLEEQEAEL